MISNNSGISKAAGGGVLNGHYRSAGGRNPNGALSGGFRLRGPIQSGGEPLKRRATLALAASEPFRVFFPAAVLAGLLGVAVWPLHFGGWLDLYPGAGHTRLMGQGFFGGFIMGFLGTAMPRMLSAPPLSLRAVSWLLACFASFVSASFGGYYVLADTAFLLLLFSMSSLLVHRLIRRRDLPPPGFVLVGLAFACGIAGTSIGLVDAYFEVDPFWLVMRPLLAYQGFVLLPVMGVGAFLLPRFLGLPNRHDYPESLTPPPGWRTRALLALSVGGGVVGSFLIEAAGWYRTAYAIRLLAVGGYLCHEVPFYRSGQAGGVIGRLLRCGLGMVLLGLALVIVMPAYRVAMLHVLLVGGLGLVTMIVATRIILAHSGQRQFLAAPNRWLWWVFGLVLLGMATRISGDFLPAILISHYNYGVLCWATGIGIWSWKVLPLVRVPDDED